MLLSAAMCRPQLQVFDVSTHYTSNAECAASSLVTGKQSITCMQPWILNRSSLQLHFFACIALTMVSVH
jgi:hypothetical protein